MIVCMNNECFGERPGRIYISFISLNIYREFVDWQACVSSRVAFLVCFKAAIDRVINNNLAQTGQ